MQSAPLFRASERTDEFEYVDEPIAHLAYIVILVASSVGPI
jgi:hypothetical protein